ncbi:MAG TPA: hypothetical protein VGB06_04220 [Solirubrobacterales bacterium]
MEQPERQGQTAESHVNPARLNPSREAREDDPDRDGSAREHQGAASDLQVHQPHFGLLLAALGAASQQPLRLRLGKKIAAVSRGVPPPVKGSR